MQHKKIRVLYLHHGTGSGGAPNSLLYLVDNLDKARYEPIIGYNHPDARIFFKENGYTPIKVPIACFSHFHPSGYYSFKNPRKIRNFLRALYRYFSTFSEFIKKIDEINPDIIHLNSLALALYAYHLKKRGYKVILHVRESAIRLNKIDIRWHFLRYLSNKYADRIIYICHDNQNKLTGRTDHSSVIYNPVPFYKFDKDINPYPVRKNLEISSKAFVIFWPGGSSNISKGIYPFLKAMSLIKKDHNNIVALVPNIKRDKEIVNYINQNSLKDFVKMVPFSRNVEKYFAASDIVVAPFIVPHFSRAVIEAFAMKKPVVGSRIGGIKELIEDKVNGLLAEPNDEEDLAYKIIELIEDDILRKRIVKAAFEIADKNLRTTIYSKKIQAVYNKIIK
jgi:glycosyltransferase involved in cell wall biosynthesis